MDIKSKNIRYSMVLKSIAVLLIWVSFAGLFASAAFLVYGHDELSKKTYSETNAFISEFSKYANYVVNYGVTLKSEDYIKSGNSLPQESKDDKITLQKRPAENRVELYKVPQGPNKETTYIIQDNNQQSESMVIITEPFERSTSFTVIHPNSDKDKQSIIEEHLHTLRESKEKLDSSVNFKYLVINRETGTYLTNLNIEDNSGLDKAINELKAQDTYIYISDDYRQFSNILYYRFSNDLKTSLANTPFELHMAVKTPLSQGDTFYEIENKFIKVHKLIPAFLAVSILSFILGSCCFIYLIATAGRKEKGGEIKLLFIDKIYNDLHFILVIIAAFISIAVVSVPAREGIFDNPDIQIYAITGLFAVLSVDLFIGLTYILSMVRHIKNRTLLKHTLIYAFFKKIMQYVKLFFESKPFTFAIISFLVCYAILNSIFFTASINEHGFSRLVAFILLAAFNVAVLIFTAKSLSSLSKIMDWVKEVSKGNLDYALDTVTMPAALSAFAVDIKNIQAGLKSAVDEAVKGERLKAELITNVSHDLKTPLTSIVNYVDLLKKEELGNENVKNYINILDEKSGRLKQLIDDLLEASKAASGNVDINFESIDMHSLVAQATAEYNDKITGAKLDIRIKSADNVPDIRGDGKLMWRIMDNLLSNIVKYAQKDSRVYIDIGNTDAYGTITVKNMSANALDIKPEELLERFVRGDQSRSKEGSGLGLSIAKSLAELQGGKLVVDIDGDLFKVTVSIPAVV